MAEEVKAEIKPTLYYGEEEPIKPEKKVPEEKKIVAVLKPIVPEVFAPPVVGYKKPEVAMPVPTEKILLDIEVTNLDHTKGRIICIGTLDLRVPNAEPKIFYDEDEEKMVKDFIDYFNSEGFNQIVGYNISFDVRYIFAKCLRYLIPCDRFAFSDYLDIMQILKQVKLTYVYTLNKPGKLDDWTYFLFGEKKPMSYEDLLRAYARKDIETVINYNKYDLMIEALLYQGIRYILKI